ncbi:MAG: xylanase deacetylase [Paenibacillaceae bacterium ZCTH02-B3]|nr:MAG: xylanase deacetylase [Paenibacillaceae bacterium ZCTH02-B3]
MKFPAPAILVVLLSLVLVTAGCSGNRESASPVPGDPAPETDASAATETPAETGSPTETETPPGPEPAPEASPAPASPEPPEPVPLYRMNAVYDIVPIDPDQADKRVVLLTFDDGPKSADTLLPMLDTLDRHGAKAIFFVNGYRVDKNPDLLKEIHDRGHAVGNHSWDHIPLGKEKPETVRDQIGRVQDIVRKLTGEAPRFFRPPHASGGEDVRRIAGEFGLLYMTWSNGSLDWDLGKVKEEDRPQAVIDNVMKQLRPGSNILMHELPWTAEALDGLLAAIRGEGYRFVDPREIAADGAATR